jgi:glycosyltransferase involved in cell wall biosynthesis
MLRIIGVGRMEPQKNIPRLIKAIQEVKQQGISVVFDWYGRKTCHTEKYQAQIHLCGLWDSFILHDATHDIVRKYQEADLFCLPSLYEGYPNVLCEAMACGLPIICSNICDNPSIIEDGVNGYLFNPYDSHDLAERIIQFITIPEEEKRQMSKRSRELAGRRFGKEAFLNKYLKLIG